MDYKQPHFYHFSEDSLKLVAIAIANLTTCPRSLLDIGCGCGVLGIETANKLDSIMHLTLLEPQSEFDESLQHNLKHILQRKISVTVEKTTLSESTIDQAFELIICNPPYFESGAGRKSPSQEKQICRSFEFDNPDLYIQKILSFLSSTGEAFILIPHEVTHWKNVLNKYSEKLKEIECLNGVSVYSIR